MTTFQEILVIIIIVSEMCTTGGVRCVVHPKCACDASDSSVVCTKEDRNITFIPKFPFYITSVHFSKKHLIVISSKTLQNLTENNITNLNLKNNNIQTVSKDAFSKLTELEYLNLNENPLLPAHEVAVSLRSIRNENFERLHLAKMKWKTLPYDMFTGVRNITYLNLKSNRFTSLNFTIFRMLENLKQLNIEKNCLRNIALDYISSLSILYLDSNGMTEMPNFCGPNGPFLPSLKELQISRNRLVVSETSFLCLQNLTVLYFNANPIHMLPNNMLSPMTSLETFMCSYNGRQLLKINSYAFNSSSLRTLIFSKNYFKFQYNTFDSVNIFKHCPQLEHLKLSDNILTLKQERFESMLRPLKNLKTLILYKTSLTTFPRRVFGLLPNLSFLDMSSNYVSTWDSDVFRNVTSLKDLRLNNNAIRIINSTSFPPNLLDSLQRLYLRSNPFSCTCDLMWFRNWLRYTNVTLINWQKNYICASPPKMENKPLNAYNPTMDTCFPPPKVLTAAVISVLSGFAISILLISILLYKGRWHIRYWVYMIRSRSKQSQIRDHDYHFDGFVVYCDEDRQWVHDQLLPVLEEEENLRLCIHFRDFDVGKLIVDNIVESIQASRKVIAVLSNNFPKSEWCQFELRVAHSKVLTEGTDNLVLVMLNEINSKNLSSFLRTLVTTTTYAVWSETASGNLLFWDQLRTAMTKPMEKR